MLFVLAKSILTVAQLYLQLLSFFLLLWLLCSCTRLCRFSASTLMSLPLTGFLLSVGCSYHSLDLSSPHFDLHFLFIVFPNISMFFCLLRKLMQRLSYFASNYIAPLWLLPQFSCGCCVCVFLTASSPPEHPLTSSLLYPFPRTPTGISIIFKNLSFSCHSC